MRTAFVLSVFEVDGNELIVSVEREDLHPDQVFQLLAQPPSLDDDPNLYGGEYDVRGGKIAEACKMFGMEPVDGVYFIGTVSL